MTRFNLHIYPSELTTESRILRLTDTLARGDIFTAIEVVGIRYAPNLLLEEKIDERRTFVRLDVAGARRDIGVLRKLWVFARWYTEILRRYWRAPIDCVNPHSVSTLPIALFFKWLKRCRLVYEPHEIETETVMQRGARRVLAKLTERALIGGCDMILLVHRVYLEWYRDAYRLDNLHVVRNLPKLPTAPIQRTDRFREVFRIPRDAIVFLTSGSIGEGRSVDIILEAFAASPPDRHVVFLGFGPGVPIVEQYARAHPNIHYHPAVSPSQVHSWVAAADVGISLIENDALSHYLSFPVRLGDYLALGVPAIVSDFPAMTEVLESHDCGWTSPVTAQGLAAVVRAVRREDLAAKSAAALAWSKANNWEQQAEHMLSLYRKLLRLDAPARP